MTRVSSTESRRLRTVRSRSDLGATLLSTGYVLVGSAAAALGWAISSDTSSSGRQLSRVGIIALLAIVLWILGGGRLLVDLGAIPRLWVWRRGTGELVLGNLRAILVRRILVVPAGGAVKYTTTIHDGIGLGRVGSGYVTLTVGDRRLTLVTTGTDIPKLESRIRADLTRAGLRVVG